MKKSIVVKGVKNLEKVELKNSKAGLDEACGMGDISCKEEFHYRDERVEAGLIIARKFTFILR